MRSPLRLVGGVFAVLLILIVIALATGWWLGTRPAEPVAASTQDFDNPALIERGAYLARLGNCAACHTTTGGEPFAGGRAIPTPFGTLYGSNITPDRDTGIGTWSADDFWRALHDGRGPDGRLLYPAFPYTSYTHLSREDADALYAFLRSQPAVSQPDRPHELRFPYDQRYLLAFWRALNFRAATPSPLSPPEGADATLWQRGSYLTEGLGHCAECHTPRNRFGGLRGDAPFAGTLMPISDWYAPALTPVRGGLQGWSVADIATLLRAGTTPHGGAAGPMAEVVFDSSQYLTPRDAEAIATYLAHLEAPAQREPGPVENPFGRLGAQRYEQHCASCHGEQGQGKGPGWPPLAGNLTAQLPDPVNAIRVVLDGGFAPGTALNPQPYGMPPFRHRLSDTDVAAILSYVRQSWGNVAPVVSPNDVRKARRHAAH